MDDHEAINPAMQKDDLVGIDLDTPVGQHPRNGPYHGKFHRLTEEDFLLDAQRDTKKGINMAGHWAIKLEMLPGIKEGTLSDMDMDDANISGYLVTTSVLIQNLLVKDDIGKYRVSNNFI